MDAITLWQNGFKTAIAPLGTSITETHLRTIFNFCQEPIFVFDSDTAGQKATMRACEMMFPMLRVGLIPKICQLQGAKDVDEFLKFTILIFTKMFFCSPKIKQYISFFEIFIIT